MVSMVAQADNFLFVFKPLILFLIDFDALKLNLKRKKKNMLNTTNLIPLPKKKAKNLKAKKNYIEELSVRSVFLCVFGHLT